MPRGALNCLLQIWLSVCLPAYLHVMSYLLPQVLDTGRDGAG